MLIKANINNEISQYVSIEVLTIIKQIKLNSRYMIRIKLANNFFYIGYAVENKYHRLLCQNCYFYTVDDICSLFVQKLTLSRQWGNRYLHLDTLLRTEASSY